MENNGKIETIIENKIAIITFSHPKSNSLPGYQLRNLADEITNAASNKEVAVIVLKSEGEKTFCAGASFDELLELENFEQAKSFFSGFGMVINAMRKCPKFIITRVQGKAVGGGVGIISASDYVFAHESASVKLSEFALGIGPFVIGPAVERKIGKAAFSKLSIDTNWYSSEWAKNNGLYAEVFTSINELDSEVKKFADILSKSSMEAALELKKMFWEGTDDWDIILTKRAEISGRLVLSDFTRNYIKQFKQS